MLFVLTSLLGATTFHAVAKEEWVAWEDFFFPFRSDCEIKVEVYDVGRFGEPSRKTPFLPYLSTTSLNSLLPTPPHSKLLGPDFVGPCATVQVQVVLAWALMALVWLVKCMWSAPLAHCPQAQLFSKIFLHSRMLVKATLLFQSYATVIGYF